MKSLIIARITAVSLRLQDVASFTRDSLAVVSQAILAADDIQDGGRTQEDLCVYLDSVQSFVGTGLVKVELTAPKSMLYPNGGYPEVMGALIGDELVKMVTHRYPFIGSVAVSINGGDLEFFGEKKAAKAA